MENENDGWVVGGDIDRVSVSLRVAAPDLDPSDVTRLFGVEPTFSARRGDKRPSKAGTITQNVGIWVLALPESPEWELGDAIAAVLDRLPSDLTVWNEIAASGEIDVFCGLHLEDWNRGVDLPASLLSRLGERKVSLGLDIYCAGPDEPDA